MSPLKITGLVVIAALCLVTMGCGGGDGGGGRTSSRGRFGLKKKRNNDVAQRGKGRGPVSNVDEYSPEASMKRDRARLVESEKAQTRVVKDMRGNLDQRNAQYTKEEEKLQNMRTRIDTYDRALQGPAVADNSRPARPATVMSAPAPRVESRAAQNTRASYSPENVYAAAPRQQAPAPRNSVAREGETVLFDPNDPEDRALMSPYMAMAAPAGGGVPQTGFTPSPYEQPNDGWTAPTTLFAKSGRESGNFPQPDLYARRAEQRAAAAAEFPPAPTAMPRSSSVQPIISNKPMTSTPPAPLAPLPPPPASFLPPASSAPAAPASVAPVAPNFPGLAPGEEEVFTPDMFLSGSR